PMQWNTKVNAGFSTASPWLPVGPDADIYNVEAERDDLQSTLSLYRRLLKLRRSSEALTIGRFASVQARGSVFAYLREWEEERYFVALNLGPEPATATPPGRCRVVLSSHCDRE